MGKPIIVVTVGRRNLAAGTQDMQQVFTGCDIDYIDSVVRAGGAPVILPIHTDMDSVRSVVNFADGIVFTGGGDICSLEYGQEPHRALMYQDPSRDRQELEAFRIALDRGVPILGVCRGIQLVNVALGGTLIQDIPSQVKHPNQHYTHSLTPMAGHTIDVEPGTVLASLLGTETSTVNSYHHQAVDMLGQDLRVNARARDGVVEGVESATGNAILAIQYHPEELTASSETNRVYFNWLIEQASEYQRRKGDR